MRNCIQIRSILVQTTDTVRYTYLLDLAVSQDYPCLFVGPTGTGKSMYILRYINDVDQACFAPSIIIGFSARTSANTTQHMVDAKLDRRRKGVFGPAAGRRLVIFVDDMNMPQLEKYGAQPPIEILRQYMDHEGWCALPDALLWCTIYRITCAIKDVVLATIQSAHPTRCTVWNAIHACAAHGDALVRSLQV
jgi:hypothetical protein